MKHLTFILSLFLAILYSNTLLANGVGIINNGADSGELLQIVESDVIVTVNNQIATITTTQVMRNTTSNEVNIKYGFPLNENANPVSLKWFINGEWEEADIGTNTQDNNVPGQGGNNGNSPNPLLLDYLGDNPIYFSPNDFIPADSLITIQLTYVELLPYFLGKVSFDYKNDISQLQSESLLHQYFSFTLESERNIESIELMNLNTNNNVSNNNALIEYEYYEQAADFDFHLEYELESDGLGIIPLSTYLPDSLFNCDDYGQGYVTMIVEPESNVNTEVIEKNFTLIIDRSGSMAGDKMVQARDAASFIVNNLNAGDYFNLIDFSSSVSSFFDSHVPYTTDNKNAALNYIETIDSGGSTNISGALSTGINQFSAVDPNKANIILFFTDGEATSGITDTPGILNTVQNAINLAETSIFLFTFGIGDDVNQALLTLLAQQNSGLVNFVANENLEEEITTFFLTINNPVLINTEITFTPDIISEIYPNPSPNLYKGQQLILSGRYLEAQTVSMHIEGQAFNVPVSYDFEINLADTNDISKSIIPKIWAKQKIDNLTLDSYLATSSSEEEAIQAEIDSISTCYGVVSVEFTSFEDNTTVEIDELIAPTSKYQITASPNPYTDFIEIEIQTDKIITEDIYIELFDLQGRSILQSIQTMSSQNAKLRLDNLEDLPAGTYICKIRIGKEIIALRIVKI